jgi:hypothetical protein
MRRKVYPVKIHGSTCSGDGWTCLIRVEDWTFVPHVLGEMIVLVADSDFTIPSHAGKLRKWMIPS